MNLSNKGCLCLLLFTSNAILELDVYLILQHIDDIHVFVVGSFLLKHSSHLQTLPAAFEGLTVTHSNQDSCKEHLHMVFSSILQIINKSDDSII